MRSRRVVLSFVCVTFLCGATCQAGENATAGLWNFGVSNFSCTNLPVSQALALLSKGTPVPINCIIDVTEEPRVSVSLAHSRLGDALQEILRPMTNYVFLAKSGTVLVLPHGLLQDSTCPLNRVIPEYKVTYIAAGRTTDHGCLFSYTSSTSLPAATFDRPPPPSCGSFPVIRHFENQTLLQILTAISSEWRASWSCGRVRPDFIRWYNDRERKGGVPVSEMWWPDESAPCYWVEWGIGAPHGEYASMTQTTDDQGKVHWKGVTVEEAEQQEQQTEAKAKEETELLAHFNPIEALIRQGMYNMASSPVQVHADVATVQVSNHTTAVELSLTITNTTPGGVRIPNPYRSVVTQAFWSVRIDRKGNGAQYEVALPAEGTAPGPEDLLLAPYSASTRVVNILGAKTLLDEKYTNPGFSGPVTDELKKPGEYTATVWLYFKEPSGNDHCVFDVREFTIR